MTSEQLKIHTKMKNNYEKIQKKKREKKTRTSETTALKARDIKEWLDVLRPLVFDC